MKKLLLIVAALGLFSFAQADQFSQRQVTGHAYTSSGYIKQGCKGLVVWTSSGFAGTISGATLAASLAPFQIPVYPQDWLGDISYTVTGGTLYTIEVR